MQQAGTQSAQNFQPYLQNGTGASTQLANLYGLNGQQAAQNATQDWQNTPGYQFTLNQGINALDASAAARGNLISGNQQQAVQKFGSGLADQYYQNYLNGLQSQAGQGLTAGQGVNGGLTNAATAFAAGKGVQNGSYNTMLNGGLINGQPNATNTNPGLLSYLINAM